MRLMRYLVVPSTPSSNERNLCLFNGKRKKKTMINRVVMKREMLIKMQKKKRPECKSYAFSSSEWTAILAYELRRGNNKC